MKKKILLMLLVCVAGLLLLLWGTSYLMSSQTKAYNYDDISSIPENKVGLLLGAGKYKYDSANNPFSTNRIAAAVELYNAGKIRYIVVSGDNGVSDYNETENLKKRLVDAGVPDSVIYLDYAGFRTLDSVIRMNKVFGQKSFTVISQKFHNERAIFIARYNNLPVVGYNAKDVDDKESLRIRVREYFAKVKVLIDFATDKQPKFLGSEIIIP